MDAWTAGYNACLAGMAKTANPWPAGEGEYTLSQHIQWNDGFNTAVIGQSKSSEKSV
jgi:hypothetical protein